MSKKDLGPKKYRPQRNLSQRNIWLNEGAGSEKIYVQQNFLFKKNFRPEKNCGSEQKNFGPKKIWLQKFWFQKNYGSKKFEVKKNLGPGKNLGPRKNLGPKMFGSKKYLWIPKKWVHKKGGVWVLQNIAKKVLSHITFELKH